MSNISKFQEAIQSDPALKAKVEAIDAPNAQEGVVQLAALANEAGFAVTVEELLAADKSSELDLDQLDRVSGGNGPRWKPMEYF